MSKKELVFLPLGGSGEIGMNMNIRFCHQEFDIGFSLSNVHSTFDRSTNVRSKSLDADLKLNGTIRKMNDALTNLFRQTIGDHFEMQKNIFATTVLESFQKEI